MNSSVIEQFKTYKKCVITTYAKILETLIVIEDNTLWQKSKDFEPICAGVTSYFVDNYYFDNNINRNNPVEYLNDNINAVLISLMDYYKNQNDAKVVTEKKNETFLISVIICVASYVDIASNVIDGDYMKMKGNLKKLLQHLSKTEILKIYVNNKLILNKLFEEVKKSVNKERKFFNYFKNDKWHNEYQIISNDPTYYKVRFIYKIDGLEKENKKVVNKFQQRYLSSYLKICYELLEVLLIKEYIMNKEVNTYLVPTIADIGDKVNILNIPLFKNNVKFMIPLERYNETNENINIIYTYHGDDINVFNNKKDFEVLVSKEFMQKNSDKLEELKNQNIILIEEKLGKRVTEEMILNYKEEIK